MKQRSDTYDELNLLEPINEQANVSLSPILSWEKGSNIDLSRVQISENLSFEPLVLDSLITSSELQTQKLSPQLSITGAFKIKIIVAAQIFQRFILL